MNFQLDEDERKRFKEWNVLHLEVYHGAEEPYGGAVGGRITFEITRTSIGQILSCRCNACPRELKQSQECLTDFSDW